jgi:DNA-binding XRE family transcriptional regulator
MRWATDILDRVNKGEKVSYSQLEKSNEIISREVIEEENEVYPRFAKNQTELAKIFKVDRKTIQRWRKEAAFPPPLSNGKWDVHATLAWVKTTGKSASVGDSLPDLHALKIKQLQLICERLEFELFVKKDEYTLNSEVTRWVGDMVMNAKTTLLAIPSKLAPQVVGLEPADAEIRLRDAIDDALSHLHTSG